MTTKRTATAASKALSDADMSALAATLQNFTALGRVSQGELIAALRTAEAHGWALSKAD